MRCFPTILAGLAALALAGCSCGDTEVEVSAMHEPAAEKQCGAFVLIPAQYETVMEEVCVQEASVAKQQIEAEYQTVKDTVVETPGHWKETPCAAEFKTVNERVLVTPGRREWQKVPCAKVPIRGGEQRGDAYCLVDIPPVYENRTKQITTRAATTKREWVPPVYKTVERRVLITAAREIEVPVEAKYEMRERRELVSPARWEWRWGDECPPGEADLVPRAQEPSPPPPFPVSNPNLPPPPPQRY